MILTQRTSRGFDPRCRQKRNLRIINKCNFYFHGYQLDDGKKNTAARRE